MAGCRLRYAAILENSEGRPEGELHEKNSDDARARHGTGVSDCRADSGNGGSGRAQGDKRRGIESMLGAGNPELPDGCPWASAHGLAQYAPGAELCPEQIPGMRPGKRPHRKIRIRPGLDSEKVLGAHNRAFLL